MKIVSRFLFFILISLTFISTSFTQTQKFRLEVINPPPPSLDFGAMAMTKSLEGTPRFFCIRIVDQSLLNTSISFIGEIEWQDVNSNVSNRFVSWETWPFPARDFCNDEIGVSILNQYLTIEDKVVDELMKKGKPSGTLNVKLKMKQNGNIVEVQEKSILFVNPSQTIDLILPQVGSQQDMGNVVAQWSPVPGASEYLLKANVRTRINQSLEDAINQGNPLIDNRSVGQSNSANLRNLLSREWKAGEEIVLQVVAVIPGIGGGEKYYSNIVNFYVYDPNSTDASAISNSLTNLLNSFQGKIDPEFLNKLLSGRIKINEIVGSDGTRMTMEDLTSLLNYLSQNPDQVINVEQISE